MLALIDTSRYVLDLGLVLLLAAGCGYLARKFGLPAVVGYLLVGVLVSPFTPGYVADREQMAVLADVGVVLLLFEVGIEIDLSRLRREQGALLWLSPAQVLTSMAIATGVLLLLGLPTLGALLLGLGVAMSSSVVVVNITRSRRRTTNPATDDALLSWSVMQDVAGVTIAGIVLALFGAGDSSVPQALGGLVAFTALAYGIARLLPRMLLLVRWEHDLFLIVSVAIGLSMAAIGAVVFGVPMALAAFVAGLVITSSSDSQHVRHSLLPFRDLFAVLFFVVIGSLVQPEYVLEALPFAALLLLLLLLGKTLLVAVAARVLRLRARPVQLAVGLSQMGEFSFVLGSVALARGELTQAQFVASLLVVVVTIIASTVAVRAVGTRVR